MRIGRKALLLIGALAVGLPATTSGQVVPLPSPPTGAATVSPHAPAAPVPPPLLIVGQGQVGTPITELPFPITTCGRYYLTKCLTSAPSQGGVVVGADDVTIDLNGFTLTGGPDSTTAISAGADIRGLTVMNGFVRDWGTAGIDLNEAFIARASHVVGVNVIACGSVGIDVYESRVDNCQVRECGIGIRGSVYCTLRECDALSNGTGLRVAVGTIERCVAHGNTGNGIEAFKESRIMGNTSQDNGGAGISIGNVQCLVDGNTLIDCVQGVYLADSRNLVIRNTFSGPTPTIVGPTLNANAYGPIIDLSNAGDISTVPGATHPWANFHYSN